MGVKRVLNHDIFPLGPSVKSVSCKIQLQKNRHDRHDRQDRPDRQEKYY